MDLDQKSAELKAARIPFCRATVVKTEGSAPRHTGARMIITADASFGTVGGGGIEHRAMAESRELLRRRLSELRRYELTEAAGTQPCGGAVEIFFEIVVPKKPIVVFGAGHIAEALCPMLLQLDFDVTLVDERRDRLALPAFSAVPHRIGKPPHEVLPTIPSSDELHLICITHAHTHDEAIVEHCLDKPFRYLGLISSRKKWAVLCEHYRKKGIDEKLFARISTPIGLDIGAETPFEIAVAIAAELIQLHNPHKHQGPQIP